MTAHKKQTAARQKHARLSAKLIATGETMTSDEYVACVRAMTAAKNQISRLQVAVNHELFALDLIAGRSFAGRK